MERVDSLVKVSGKRFSVLDSLRGIAALCVVLFHFTYGYDNGLNILSNDHFYFRYGYLGVQLFFMISGFVILMTLERTEDSRSFLTSRFSRLYPAYWSAIILTVLITMLLGAPFQKGIYSIKQVIVNFTMLQRWLGVKDVDGAYWTLAVELWFYVMMWAIFKIKKLQYIHWFAFAWIVLSFAFYAFNIPYGKYIKALFILQHVPLFAAGIGFFMLSTKRRTLIQYVLILTSLTCEFLILYKDNSRVVPYIVIACFYLVFYMFINKKLEFLSNRLLLFMGSISYSLYLIHENIGMAIIYWIKQGIDHQLVYVPITMVVVFGFAYLITKYIERPALKWIRSYFDSSKTVRVQNEGFRIESLTKHGVEKNFN